MVSQLDIFLIAVGAILAFAARGTAERDRHPDGRSLVLAVGVMVSRALDDLLVNVARPRPWSRRRTYVEEGPAAPPPSY